MLQHGIKNRRIESVNFLAPLCTRRETFFTVSYRLWHWGKKSQTNFFIRSCFTSLLRLKKEPFKKGENKD